MSAAFRRLLILRSPGSVSHRPFVQRGEDFSFGTYPLGYLHNIAGANRPVRLDPRVGVDQTGRAMAGNLQDEPEPF